MCPSARLLYACPWESLAWSQRSQPPAAWDNRRSQPLPTFDHLVPLTTGSSPTWARQTRVVLRKCHGRRIRRGQASEALSLRSVALSAPAEGSSSCAAHLETPGCSTSVMTYAVPYRQRCDPHGLTDSAVALRQAALRRGLGTVQLPRPHRSPPPRSPRRHPSRVPTRRLTSADEIIGTYRARVTRAVPGVVPPAPGADSSVPVTGEPGTIRWVGDQPAHPSLRQPPSRCYSADAGRSVLVSAGWCGRCGGLL